MTRTEILKHAAKIAGEDRQQEYGDPWMNLTNTATLWEAYIMAKFDGRIIDPLQFKLTAEDVAWLNVLQKMSRTFVGKPKMDTYVDAAAYAAIAGEVAQEDSFE